MFPGHQNSERVARAGVTAQDWQTRERLSRSDRVRADRACEQRDAPSGGERNNGNRLPPDPSVRAADPGPRRGQESDMSSLLSTSGKGQQAPEGVQKTTPHYATTLPESVGCTESDLLLTLPGASPLASPRNSQGAPAAAASPGGGHVESAPSIRGEGRNLNADAGAMPTRSEIANSGRSGADFMLDEQAIERAIADAERVHAKQVADEEAVTR